MAERLERHMTCDRCNAEWVGELSDQPPNWIGLKYTNPPMADLGEANRLILCWECRDDLTNWLNTPPGYAKTGAA